MVSRQEGCAQRGESFRNTMTRRTEDLGGNVYDQLHEKASEFEFFAFDESNDVQDTAQLLIFI